jgi:hypothetical protein
MSRWSRRSRPRGLAPGWTRRARMILGGDPLATPTEAPGTLWDLRDDPDGDPEGHHAVGDTDHAEGTSDADRDRWNGN